MRRITITSRGQELVAHSYLHIFPAALWTTDSQLHPHGDHADPTRSEAARKYLLSQRSAQRQHGWLLSSSAHEGDPLFKSTSTITL